jgi:hypothetical protein
MNYIDSLNYLVKNNSDQLVFNKGLDRKLSALSVLVDSSTNELRFFEKSSSLKEYNLDFIKCLKDFIIEKNGSIKILSNGFPKDSSIFEFVKNPLYAKNIKISTTERKFISHMQEAYFVLGDNSRFASFFDFNNDRRMIANFNSKSGRYFENFNTFFEKIFDNPEHSESFSPKYN